MSMEPDYAWLDEHIEIAGAVARGLGVGAWEGRSKRVVVVDELADQLGLNPNDLRYAGYLLLWSLVETLEANVSEEGEGSIYENPDRHRRIARAAVSDFSYPLLIDAAHEFGWQRHKIRGDTEWAELAEKGRELMAADLANPIFKLLERWRKKNAWADELGLVKLT